MDANNLQEIVNPIKDKPLFFGNDILENKKKEAEKGSGIVVAVLFGLILLFCFTTLHYRSECQALERSNDILKADNERLAKTSHNPFVHARK